MTQLLVRVLLLGLVSFSAWAGNEFKIITLQHRFGEELLAVLQPLAGPGGVVTASGNNLFVEVDAARMLAIEQAVARMDVESRMFGIRLDRSGQQHSASSGAEVAGRIGNEVRIERSGSRRNNSGITVGVDARETTTRSRSSEYLNVMDGASAFIAVGQSVPFTETWRELIQRHGRVRQAIGYRDIVTGFTVTPRQMGDAVELEITPRISSMNGDIVEFESLSTRVRAVPGTWLNLGGTMSSRDDLSREIFAGSRGESSRSGELWILIDAK